MKAEPPPRDTLDVAWTPMKHGYDAALTDLDPLEVEHTAESLQEIFEKYGDIVKLRARRAES